MSDKAIADKYNAYLPIEDIFDFTGIERIGPVKGFCGVPYRRGSFFKKRLAAGGNEKGEKYVQTYV